MFAFNKIIDRSTLREGFQITIGYHKMLYSALGKNLQRGETITVKILIDGKPFEVLLKNQLFDEIKYPDHPDVIQVRYTINSPFAKKLRELFTSTWNYVSTTKALPENVNRKFTIKVPDEKKEHLVIYSTDLPGVFVADYMTASDTADFKEDIKGMNEVEFELSEQLIKHDDSTSIGYGTALQKIRHLDRSIANGLKELYDYRCQMTGEKIGDKYDALCVEAHHIEPFSQSLNNDYSNIIILSPNYHRIIHKTNPTFDKKHLQFVFPNGLKECVKLNKHLTNK